jgi:hypothetical protein
LGGVSVRSASIKENELKNDMQTLYEVSPFIFYKIEYAQPIISVLVEADELSGDELIRIAQRFDDLIIPLRKYSGGIAFSKLGVFGIIVFVFFDSEKKRRIQELIISKCRASHFLKKIYTISWIIDVTEKKITTHNGLPLISSSTLNKAKIEKALRG